MFTSYFVAWYKQKVVRNLCFFSSHPCLCAFNFLLISRYHIHLSYSTQQHSKLHPSSPNIYICPHPLPWYDISHIVDRSILGYWYKLIYPNIGADGGCWMVVGPRFNLAIKKPLTIHAHIFTHSLSTQNSSRQSFVSISSPQCSFALDPMRDPFNIVKCSAINATRS